MMRNRGFTLTEILTTLGIIALLVGIIMPMLLGALRQGEASKTRADLNTISIALEAYKSEHGHYPRFTAADADLDPDRGARRLFSTLVGENGQGFLAIDDFKIIEVDGAPVLADVNGNPILYYPAHPVRYDLTQRHAYLAHYDPRTGLEIETNEQLRRASLFNAFDNAAFLPKDGLMRVMDAAAGGDNLGGIGSGRMTPRFAGAYMLLAAGPDGEFATEDDIVFVGGGVPPVPQIIGVDGALAASQGAPQFAMADDWALPVFNPEIGDAGFVLPPAYRREPPAPVAPEIPAPRPTSPPADAINIMDFGAQPNDGQDDTAAIRQAIEQAHREGKAVVFPEGQFDVRDTIEVRPGGSYFGPGIVNFTGSGDKSAFKVPGDAGDILIDGLTFDGAGISFHSRHNNITIVNNVFRNITLPGIMPGTAIFANGGMTNSLIQNNHFYNVARDGIFINSNADRTIIDSNYFDNVFEAVHVISNGGRNITFTNNVGVRLIRMGIEFQGYDAADTLVQNNVFKDWQQDKVYHGSFALSIVNAGPGTKVLDNQVFGFGNNPVGIEFSSTENGVLAGNLISGFREGTHLRGRNIQVHGNHYIGQTWMSIWFLGKGALPVHNTHISGNKFTNPSSVFRFGDSQTQGTVIDGNEIYLSGNQRLSDNDGNGVTFGNNTIIRN